MRWTPCLLFVFLLGAASLRTAEVPPAAEEKPLTEAPSTNKPAYQIPPNQILTFKVPLSSAAKQAVLNSKNPPVDSALAAIAVPSGFDPGLPYPILIIGGSSDGAASSIRVMTAFTNVALRLGWVVIAADGLYGKPPNDNPPWRWAMLSALLEHIQRTWPQSKTWPIVCAGVSGGGKWAGVMGAIMAKQGYNVIGVFMGAVNQDMASEAAKLYEPAVRYKQVPIYLSSGTEDKVATPQHHQEVKESLLHNGFSTVRLETFKGGHALSEGELRSALNWFLEEYSKPPEVPRPLAKPRDSSANP